MKFSTLSPIIALFVTWCIALPAPIPTPTHVPVSQDPSPPRPFPAGRIVEVKDPSPPRPFPKYALEGEHALDERDALALSRFPTDGENVAHDPSPPRPFQAGRIVEVKDPSPPRPFPKYALEGEHALDERDALALSRFPTDGENVAHDPSPPRPFPAGRIVEVKNPSPPLEERDPSAPHKLVEDYPVATDPSPPRPFPKYPLDGGNAPEERNPLSRFPSDGEKEAADPSPPRPFPAGRFVEATNPPPSDVIEQRSPSPLLRTTEGSEAEAADPSPPQPFPAGHVGADVEPRNEEPPPHRGHGGYFPPSNPTVSEPTAAPAISADLSSCPYRCPFSGSSSCCSPYLPVPPVTLLSIYRLPSPTASLIPEGGVRRGPPTPLEPPCTTTRTAFAFDKLNRTGTSTLYAATTKLPLLVDCGGCLEFVVTTVDTGNGPAVVTDMPTVTVTAETTEYFTLCEPSSL